MRNRGTVFAFAEELKAGCVLHSICLAPIASRAKFFQCNRVALFCQIVDRIIVTLHAAILAVHNLAHKSCSLWSIEAISNEYDSIPNRGVWLIGVTLE